MLDSAHKSRLWQPPRRLEKPELVAISDAVLAEPDIEFSESEDILQADDICSEGHDHSPQRAEQDHTRIARNHTIEAVSNPY